jgi:hypothetical protein
VDLRSGKYDDPAASAKATLELLSATSATYEALAERTKTFRRYEELFAMPPSNYGDVDQVRERASPLTLCDPLTALLHPTNTR